MGKNGGRQTLSKEMLEAIAEKAAEIAAAVATNTYQQKVKEEEKAKFDKRYKNTKLLLEHYRDFSDYGERAIYRIYEELDEDIVDIIELMEGRRSDSDGRIESIERGGNEDQSNHEPCEYHAGSVQKKLRTVSVQ